MKFNEIDISKLNDVNLRRIIINNKFIEMSNPDFYTFKKILEVVYSDSSIIIDSHLMDKKHIFGVFYRDSDSNVIFLTFMNEKSNSELLESYIYDSSSHLSDYSIIDGVKYFLIHPLGFEPIL